MKTKILYRLAVVIVVTATIFAACKKSDVSNPNTGMTSADLQTQSDDQTRVSNETDALTNDVNTTMSAQATVTGSSVTPGVRGGVGRFAHRRCGANDRRPTTDTTRANVAGGAVLAIAADRAVGSGRGSAADTGRLRASSRDMARIRSCRAGIICGAGGSCRSSMR